MDFKQVYLTNGQPYLAFKGEDGEYQYPKDEWTETPPPAEDISLCTLMVINGCVLHVKNG